MKTKSCGYYAVFYFYKKIIKLYIVSLNGIGCKIFAEHAGGLKEGEKRQKNFKKSVDKGRGV